MCSNPPTRHGIRSQACSGRHPKKQPFRLALSGAGVHRFNLAALHEQMGSHCPQMEWPVVPASSSAFAERENATKILVQSPDHSVDRRFARQPRGSAMVISHEPIEFWPQWRRPVLKSP
jgi:hypothetical protein